MFRLRRINHEFIVNYKEETHIFVHHESAWAFIFGVRKGLEK